jgi:hypothetical protein
MEMEELKPIECHICGNKSDDIEFLPTYDNIKDDF